MRNLHDIVTELRAHPDCVASIVWTAEDCPDDIEPDSVNWGSVEDRCIELGSEVIWDAGTLRTKWELRCDVCNVVYPGYEGQDCDVCDTGVLGLDPV